MSLEFYKGNNEILAACALFEIVGNCKISFIAQKFVEAYLIVSVPMN